jgi:hypothetical protein
MMACGQFRETNRHRPSASPHRNSGAARWIRKASLSGGSSALTLLALDADVGNEIEDNPAVVAMDQ